MITPAARITPTIIEAHEAPSLFPRLPTRSVIWARDVRVVEDEPAQQEDQQGRQAGRAGHGTGEAGANIPEPMPHTGLTTPHPNRTATTASNSAHAAQ